MPHAGGRVRVYDSQPGSAIAEFAADVGHYLQQQPRQLPSRYLYDPLGSALFDAICQLPWYRLTAAEMRLLRTHGRDILSHAGPPARVVELGSGNGDKLAALVAAGRMPAVPLGVHLIDISPAALATASRALAVFDHVRVVGHEADYETGLRNLAREIRPAGPTLIVFLGSNIGNYDPPGAAALLRQVRLALRPGDHFLIGVDLTKPEADLQLAYDDPLGVTAAFNRNLLVRINRELAGDFDLAAFTHAVHWNAADSRIEMRLVSTKAQTVTIPHAGLELAFAAGEFIWTESSYKYEVQTVARLLAAAGFEVRQQWFDDEARFALTLAGVDG